jgi:hypothetical protein
MMEGRVQAELVGYRLTAEEIVRASTRIEEANAVAN